MSERILKFWPVHDPGSSQVDLLTTHLREDDLIAEPTSIDRRPAYWPGKRLEVYLFQPVAGMKIEILPNSTIPNEDETPGTERRANVIAIHHADDSASEWTDMEEYLREVTGVEYRGGWLLFD